MKEPISTTSAPAAIGPYSQAIRAGGFVFLSGQIPLDPATGQLIEGDVAAQTVRVLDNLKAVLEACGSSLGRVVKTTGRIAARFKCSNRRTLRIPTGWIPRSGEIKPIVSGRSGSRVLA